MIAELWRMFGSTQSWAFWQHFGMWRVINVVEKNSKSRWKWNCNTGNSDPQPKALQSGRNFDATLDHA